MKKKVKNKEIEKMNEELEYKEKNLEKMNELGYKEKNLGKMNELEYKEKNLGKMNDFFCKLTCSTKNKFRV